MSCVNCLENNYCVSFWGQKQIANSISVNSIPSMVSRLARLANEKKPNNGDSPLCGQFSIQSYQQWKSEEKYFNRSWQFRNEKRNEKKKDHNKGFEDGWMYVMTELICEQIKNWKFNHVHQTSDFGECLFSAHEINDIVFANLFTACSRKRTSYIVDRVHSHCLA